jgi:hypothetical protein
VKSEGLGEVIQLQGDQRNKVYEFLSTILGLKKTYVSHAGSLIALEPSKCTDSKSLLETPQSR